MQRSWFKPLYSDETTIAWHAYQSIFFDRIGLSSDDYDSISQCSRNSNDPKIISVEGKAMLLYHIVAIFYRFDMQSCCNADLSCIPVKYN